MDNKMHLETDCPKNMAKGSAGFLNICFNTTANDQIPMEGVELRVLVHASSNLRVFNPTSTKVHLRLAGESPCAAFKLEALEEGPARVAYTVYRGNEPLASDTCELEIAEQAPFL